MLVCLWHEKPVLLCTLFGCMPVLQWFMCNVIEGLAMRTGYLMGNRCGTLDLTYKEFHRRIGKLVQVILAFLHCFIVVWFSTWLMFFDKVKLIESFLKKFSKLNRIGSLTR